MKLIKLCQENECGNNATHDVFVVLRSRPGVLDVTSNRIASVCNDHMNQKVEEFIPETVWNKMVNNFKASNRPVPIKFVSYLIYKELKN